MPNEASQVVKIRILDDRKVLLEELEIEGPRDYYTALDRACEIAATGWVDVVREEESEYLFESPSPDLYPTELLVDLRMHTFGKAYPLADEIMKALEETARVLKVS